MYIFGLARALAVLHLWHVCFCVSVWFEILTCKVYTTMVVDGINFLGGINLVGGINFARGLVDVFY